MPVWTHGDKLKCCDFLKVLLLVQCKVSLCLLPGHRAASSQQLPAPICFGCLCARGFPSFQALPPFTLYLWTWHMVLKPICVCKCLRNLETSLNILHVSTNRFPSTPVGRGEQDLFSLANETNRFTLFATVHLISFLGHI